MRWRLGRLPRRRPTSCPSEAEFLEGRVGRVVAGFVTSHSTMQFSSRENWQAMFYHVDCRGPIYFSVGKPLSFDELLKATPTSASSKISAAAQADRHQQTMNAMDRLQTAIAAAQLDVLVV